MTAEPTVHAYGYVDDEDDPRDHLMPMVSAPALLTLPRRVMLADTPNMPPVWDQLQLGSCTAHGVLAAFLFTAAKLGLDVPMLSRLMLYYNSRALEGSTDQDVGARVRDAIKATLLGIAPEGEWPYDIARFAVRPPATVVKDGQSYEALQYERVTHTLSHYRVSLADGWPVVDGMPVYESMETQAVASSGHVPMPSLDEQLMGLHCTLTVGYDLDASDGHGGKGVLYKRNSWGTSWGLKAYPGYFTVPLRYRTHLSDPWRITSVS